MAAKKRGENQRERTKKTDAHSTTTKARKPGPTAAPAAAPIDQTPEPPGPSAPGTGAVARRLYTPITSTSFFRDAEAWRVLSTEVIAPLVGATQSGAPIRAWCADCATGEEAYSLGILILEQLSLAGKSCPIQIFATDIDDDSIAVARRGIYPVTISAAVSQVRLAQFFDRVNESSYQVCKQLRETVIFSRHDLASDVPFSRLDLVASGDVLECLEQPVLEKVISVFHYALNETGWLFLHSSTSIAPSTGLFQPLFSRWRIYRRIGPRRVRYPLFPAMRSAIEELESSNKTLSATSAAVMSMNEDLLSANEELETSKEELQSLNEEFSAVTSQLRHKIRDLESANNDLGNFLDCPDLAIVFVDPRLRIRRFTSAATRVFTLIPADIGRPISDLVKRFADDDMLKDARQCLGDARPREREVRLDDSSWYLRRIGPYRSLDNRIDGIVFTFVDVTERKQAADAMARNLAERTQAEAAVRAGEARLQAILSTAADAIITIDQSGLIQSVNTATERMFEYAAAEMIGQNVKMLMPPPYADEHDHYLARYMHTRENHIIGIGREANGRRKNGSVFPISLAVSDVEHLKLFTGIIRDITRHKQLEREIVEIASLQQRRIGQDLHDTVSQQLTALRLQAADLSEMLPADSVEVTELADRIGKGMRRCHEQLRILMRGLLPVSVDAEGLMAALSDLVDQTSKLTKVTCTFSCPEPVVVSDNLTATHLYLIAHEAIHNALKHAKAREIRISLESNDFLKLCVEDDGIGSPQTIEKKFHSSGLGLRIMQNRAAIIGANLTFEASQPTGTRVLCTLSRPNNAKEQNRQAT